MSKPRLSSEWIQKYRPNPKYEDDPTYCLSRGPNGTTITWIFVGGVYLCTQEIEDMKRIAEAAKSISDLDWKWIWQCVLKQRPGNYGSQEAKEYEPLLKQVHELMEAVHGE